MNNTKWLVKSLILLSPTREKFHFFYVKILNYFFACGNSNSCCAGRQNGCVLYVHKDTPPLKLPRIENISAFGALNCEQRLSAAAGFRNISQDNSNLETRGCWRFSAPDRR
jgi:hypothetical protein